MVPALSDGTGCESEGAFTPTNSPLQSNVHGPSEGRKCRCGWTRGADSDVRKRFERRGCWSERKLPAFVTANVERRGAFRTCIHLQNEDNITVTGDTSSPFSPENHCVKTRVPMAVNKTNDYLPIAEHGAPICDNRCPFPDLLPLSTEPSKRRLGSVTGPPVHKQQSPHCTPTVREGIS